MELLKRIFGINILFLFLLGAVNEAKAISFAGFAYQNAKQANIIAIKNYLKKGYKIDSLSPNGYTALCYAAAYNDYPAYSRLRNLGADENHECMQKVNPAYVRDLAQRYDAVASHPNYASNLADSDTSKKYLIAGTALAGTAAAVALLADSGSGSSSGNVCPEGQKWDGTQCVDIKCPEGTQLVGNECVDTSCPTGQKWNGSKCVDIECPENTHLVGNNCVADDIDIDNDNDQDVYGIYSEEEDVYNLRSDSEYPDKEANINIDNKGNGNVYGIYGFGNIRNADVADNGNVGTGNIVINNQGTGNVFGIYSHVDDISFLKEAYVALGQFGGTAYGNLEINNQGGGSVIGVYGDVRAYNARTNFAGSKAEGNITIHSDGDIYGLSGYTNATNSLSYDGGGDVKGSINLYSSGDGDIYGMAVSPDGIPEVGQPEEGGTLRNWFAYNSAVYWDGAGPTEGATTATGIINIHNTGNGNVYGMHGGVELQNAIHQGGVDEDGKPIGVADGLINIVNLGNGDVYGMYTLGGNDGTSANIGNITNEGAHSVISIVNAGNGVTAGLYGGKDAYIENSGDININNLGNGAVYGIYGSDGADIRNGGLINIYSQSYQDSVTGQTYSPSQNSNASVYGIYAGLQASVANVFAQDNEINSGEMRINHLGNGNVYGIYSGGDAYNAKIQSNWIWETAYNPETNSWEYVLDEDGNKIPAGFSSGQVAQVSNIVNHGDGDVYALYAKGNVHNVYQQREYDDKYGYSDEGIASGIINVLNVGNGNVFGLYSYGEGQTVSNRGETSIVNLVNTGDGVTTGLRGGQGSYIENSGEININNLGSGTAVGIYGGANSNIINSGTIDIYREAYEDEETGQTYNPDGEKGGTAYGIYAESGSYVTNTGTITVTGAEKGTGIYLEAGGTLENSGTVIFNDSSDASIQENGDAIDIYGDGTERASVNLNDLGGEVILSQGGRFFADSLTGDMSVSEKTVLGELKNEYVLSGALQANDVDSLSLNSKSAMFEASSQKSENGGYDVVMTRQNFNDIIEDSNISDYLENNYVAGNGSKLFDVLKKAQTNSVLNQKAANLLGTDMLPNFRREDALLYRNLSRQFNDNLFNQPNQNYIGGYKYVDISTDADGTLMGTDGQAHVAYGMMKNKNDSGVIYGLGASIAKLNSDYDNGSKRDANIFGVWAPVGYDFDNGAQWYSKLYLGYVDGSYDRITDLQKYSDDISEFQYGLSNEIRYSLNLGGGFTFSPLAELNLFGVYSDGYDEGNNEGAIHTDSQNDLSLEGGLGAYLAKKVDFSDDSHLTVQIGGVYYVEFLDPDDGFDASISALDGKYKLAHKSDDGRAVLSARVNYNYKDITLYGNIEKETSNNKSLLIDAGVQYKF